MRSPPTNAPGSSEPSDPAPVSSPERVVGAKPKRWGDLLAEAEAILGSRTDARRILEEASGYDGAEMILRLGEPVPARSGAHLAAMVERRAAGEPLQYVVGRWGFRTLDLFVDRRVLIPRPETEQVVEWALEETRTHLERRRAPGHKALAADLGTGSGAIALSLAVELGAEVWATDVSRDALDVARANLAGIGMWAATRVRVVEGSWWSALPHDVHGQLDLVVSNPPYVGAAETLPPEVDLHEPSLALRSGPDGLDAIAAIVGDAGDWLAPGGILVVELAPAQAEVTMDLARRAGAARVETRTDALGRVRALVAQWPDPR
jgi:release factor glutamine methyltransferase